MHNPAILKLIFLEHDGDLERLKATLRTLGVVPAGAAHSPVHSLTSTASTASAPSNYWVTLAGQIASVRATRGLPLTLHTTDAAAGNGHEPSSRGFTVRIHSRISLMEPAGGSLARRQP